MKTGDLITLSAYAKQTQLLNRWGHGPWIKKPLVGIIVKVEDVGDRKYYSKNESMRYYVNWMQGDAPGSRHGKYASGSPYFYRKDLKFVSKS